MSATISMTADGLSVPDNPTIPFIEGDGIGPDIWAAASRVLDASVETAYGGAKKIEWREVLAGQKAFDATGSWLPDETLDVIREHLVAIKGPLTTPVGGGIRSLNVALRQILDLYVCLRPVRYFEGVPSPVKRPEDVDMVIFRENTEDIYAGIEFEAGTEDGRRFRQLLEDTFPKRFENVRFPDTTGFGIKPVSQEGTARLVTAALDFAVREGRASVTLVHKGNIMKFTEGAFRDWGYDVAKEHFGAVEIDGGPWCQIPAGTPGAGIVIKDAIADITLQQVLTRPTDFDVIATLNLNGDYLSDATRGAGRRHRHRAGRQHQLQHRRGRLRGDARHGAEVRRAGQGQPVVRHPLGRDDAALHGLDRGRGPPHGGDGDDDPAESASPTTSSASWTARRSSRAPASPTRSSRTSEEDGGSPHGMTPPEAFVAGPNGAGKTTLALEIAADFGIPYVGADDIAARLSPADPAAARVAAGRAFFAEVERLADDPRLVRVREHALGPRLRRRDETPSRYRFSRDGSVRVRHDVRRMPCSSRRNACSVADTTSRQSMSSDGSVGARTTSGRTNRQLADD